jgi:hypothetical protein
VECVTKSRQDKGIKETNSVTQFQFSLTYISDNRRNAETQKIRAEVRADTSSRGIGAFNRLLIKYHKLGFFTLLLVETGFLMADL